MRKVNLVNKEYVGIGDDEFTCGAQKKAQTPPHSWLQWTMPTSNQVVVGFHDEAGQIIFQLTGGSGALDGVSIVDMPGLGKTTLGNKVYQDPMIICHFHIRAWCRISQVYGKKEVLGRYLLVLDDVWDIAAWNALKVSFPNDANGSRILLTSRISKLALEVKPASKPLHLRQLTDDEYLELLQKKLAERGGNPPALFLHGKHIAKGCKGLPLTVVITAGILANLEQDGWEEIAERLSSDTVCGTEHCKSILELSYKHLAHYLKPCLLYFGPFREDQEIPIWTLMRLWTAEGFVQKTEAKRIEDRAEDYIMDLIGRSLVMVDKQKSTGGIKTCRIHDLLHEFCLRKATDENLLRLRRDDAGIPNFDEPSNTRRLFIYSKARHFQKSRLFCPLLSSLVVSTQSEEYGTPYNVSSIFRIFKLLRVLDLGKINLGFVFPSEITLLVQLRYLAFAGSMNYIPSSIANLWNLETFILKSLHGILFLPDTVWNLQTLRCLCISGKFFDLSLAKDNLDSSSDLCNLDTISALELDLGQSQWRS
ncbi:putative late blight resistance protein homolog R1B-14 [Coffea arabica]|uniref:Late blight resistance protein homolog R1B-14 n=1 Tax=Coffea arabica TaxID=13443 RepID=A0A6P6TVC7_COFAR|nr:putative late blight resistance protein homolog R1B-17 [Coffea arabica]